MTKPYYECHITLWESEHYTKAVCQVVERMGWTYSAIARDIVEGSGIKLYATRHFNADKMNVEQVKQALKAAANQLRDADFNVIREKVELVLHDERFK